MDSEKYALSEEQVQYIVWAHWGSAGRDTRQ